MRRLIAALTLALAALAAAPLRAEALLVMVEERGCLWCARWTEEIGPEYPLTAEGRAAPLRRVNLHGPLPEDIAFAGSLRVTPTFVLVRDGVEVSRLEGYPGEDFFWGLLGRMLTDAEIWDEADDGTG
jgi:hypothetical protein